MTKRARRRRNGPQPTKKLIAEQGAKGYYPIASLAKEYDVGLTTIYDWVNGGKLSSPDGRPAHYRHRGNIWVLGEAVRAKVEPPALPRV